MNSSTISEVLFLAFVLVGAVVLDVALSPFLRSMVFAIPAVMVFLNVDERTRYPILVLRSTVVHLRLVEEADQHRDRRAEISRA